ncbi:DUF7144 family membrane protein [Micromonospora sp. WMMD558]|uniref:DUF7144 family membrane protein n=1 Tax=Micromonospora sp. WMMD558 TaxID=3403462 RepID=UPI003BF54DC6
MDLHRVRSRQAEKDARHRGVLLASGLLVGSGVIDAVAAYADTSSDRFVVVTEGGLHLLDLTGWNWLLVGVAVAVAVAGILVMAGRRWTSAVGLAAALLALGLDLAFIPYAPLHVILVAGLNIAAARLLLRHLMSRRSPR